MPKFDEMADQVVAAMRGYVAQAVGTLSKRLDAVEAMATQALVYFRETKDGANGIDGKDGANGLDGKDGRDGVDGVSVDVAAVRGLVVAVAKESIEKIVVPLKDGRDGVDGIAGKDGAPGERGERGESGLAGTAGAPGRDGTHGEKGIDGRDGRDGKDGRDGAQGKDGSNGRDALDIDILPALDLARSYPAGTFALRRGGLVRSFRDTEPFLGSDNGTPLESLGWRVITNGISSATTMQIDERNATVRCELTDGTISETHFVLPTVLFRGVWREGAYKQNDQVVRSGSVWTCLRDTASEPGNGATDWVLSAKKGADGRDGKDGKGERGPEGKAGRDLTQMAFDGTKY